MEIRLTKEQKITVNGPQAIFNIMQQILLRENKIGRNKEHFWVIGLATSHKILFIELVSLGSINKAIVDPGEVFQLSIHKDAVTVILVHNHPSGNLTPSDPDKDITDNLIQAGRIIHKEIMDHLIINESEYYSFRDSGLLDELRRSKKYALKYLEEKRIREEGEELGGKRKAVEMAKGMKQRAIETQIIAELSGLSIEEIEKL